MAGKLHKKMEQLHKEAATIRDKRTSTSEPEKTEFAAADDRKRSASKKYKLGCA